MSMVAFFTRHASWAKHGSVAGYQDGMGWTKELGPCQMWRLVCTWNPPILVYTSPPPPPSVKRRISHARGGGQSNIRRP